MYTSGTYEQQTRDVEANEISRLGVATLKEVDNFVCTASEQAKLAARTGPPRNFARAVSQARVGWPLRSTI